MTDDTGTVLADLAQDWVTLWQSEMTALARDREAQEHWASLVGLWAGMAGRAIAAGPGFARSHDGHPTRSARSNEQAGSAPLAAASDPGGEPGADELTLDALHQRIATLEARLATLDRLAALDRGDKPGRD